MLRNFEKFEVGHYYVYTGNKSEVNWNSSGAMDFVLKHEMLQCSSIRYTGAFSMTHTVANFKEHERDDDGWDWSGGFDNWVEVESPEAVFEIGDDVLRYDKVNKHSRIFKVSEGYFHNDENKNGYDNGVGVFYICKRKSNKKEETKKSKRYLCPHCKSDRTGLNVKTEESTKCGNCLSLYSYDKESDSLVMAHSPIQENVPCGTPIKMSLGSIQKEPMVLNSDFKKDESWELSGALSKWVSFWNRKVKELDKKENVFKKYIRTKKYMKFVKEKK